ncbi:dolichyl-phosphate beta-D-mannosyltransferase [Halogeometricum pallidum JCM 14848]|uniref:Dolichyl-phosphate beta-D-mannosyltransferase n=1 Tax=Halogeometricum pallidum JCM 14848 TaxID=1227487 RepID=M0DBA8_HALPD|nr:glycosyltransferase [Halogeometricum pallidum]ELZ31464.1 dolichyl-phosphate beta-D-mannosyltransferase [Halogeometricum pallidum JCM 14848]
MQEFTRQTVIQFDGDSEPETGGDSVSVQKSVSRTGEKVVVEYELAVERETPVSVRVVDAIPADERVSRFRGDVHYYELSERGLELYAAVGRDPVTRVSVSFHGPATDVDRFDSTPDVDLIRTLPAALEDDADPRAVAAGNADGDDDRPAVGVVATASNGDALVRTVLRSLTRGFVVLVGDRGDADREALRLCERFGATRVSLPSADDEGDLRRVLAAAARARSLPGVVFQESPDRRIDFDRSLADFRRAGERSITARYEGDSDARDASASLAVGILARDEADRIGDAVATAQLFADEVIVVDENSADGTGNRATAAGATVRRTEGDRRSSEAFRSLFRTVAERDVDALAVVEADGRYDIGDLPRLLEDHRQADAEITVGRRSEEPSRSDVFSLRSLRRWAATRPALAGRGAVRLHPLAAGFRSGLHIYDRRALASLAADESVREASDIGAGVLSHAAKCGYRVREVGD